jgi:hypothetical protein
MHTAQSSARGPNLMSINITEGFVRLRLRSLRAEYMRAWAAVLAAPACDMTARRLERIEMLRDRWLTVSETF